MEQSGAGVGADARATGMVSNHGGMRRTGAIANRARSGGACGSLARRYRRGHGQAAHRLSAEPGRGGLHSELAASGEVAGGWLDCDRAGPLWASHHNCRSLANWNRQLTDEQIKALVERGAGIGMAFDAIMMVHGWTHMRSKSMDFSLKVERICEHVDHVC